MDGAMLLNLSQANFRNDDDAARLAALRAYQLTPDDPDNGLYADLVGLARALGGTETAFISIVEQDRQWFKASQGLDVTETPRSIAFCDHAIRQSEVMVVLDACFSGDSAGGALFKNISPALLKNTSPVRELKQNAFVLCGADKDQVCAWFPEKRHSLLTYYFFEALQGKADRNRDRKLTAGEIYAYVSDAVNRRALRATGRNQNPKLMGRRDLVVVEF
jgi:hypothetical protein